MKNSGSTGSLKRGRPPRLKAQKGKAQLEGHLLDPNAFQQLEDLHTPERENSPTQTSTSTQKRRVKKGKRKEKTPDPSQQ